MRGGAEAVEPLLGGVLRIRLWMTLLTVCQEVIKDVMQISGCLKLQILLVTNYDRVDVIFFELDTHLKKAELLVQGVDS